MRRLVSHDTWASIIGMISLGMVANLLLVISCLPFVVLLVTTDPALSWPMLALVAPLSTPGIAAAFRAFREHDDGGLGPIRAFWAGYRATWRRALLLGVVATAVVVVLLIDVRAMSTSPAAVVIVPVLGTLTVLVAAVALLSLVALAEVPTARWRDMVGAAAILGVRRWYLTVVSLAAIVVQAGIFASAPAIGLGITASAILYLAWTNSRFTLRPVLDLDDVAAVSR